MVDLSGSWLNVDRQLVREIHLDTLREFGPSALQYTDTAGVPEARETLRQLLSKAGFGAYDVLFTNSWSDSFKIVVETHLNPGDCIRAERPTRREVFSYKQCAGGKLAYIQPIWRDPDGYIYPRRRVAEIAKSTPLAVFDLTYGLLVANDLPAWETVVVIGSLDVLFPGLHLGYVAAPRELLEVYLTAVEVSYLHPPTYMQYLFYTAVDRGAVWRVFDILTRRADLASKHLCGRVTPYFAWHRARDKSIYLKHGAVDGSVYSRERYVKLGLTSATEEELEAFFAGLPPEEFQNCSNRREF